MRGIAIKAERMRIAKRAVRQMVKGELVETKKDLLDWLKYAQMETEGIRLDLTELLDAYIAKFQMQPGDHDLEKIGGLSLRKNTDVEDF